MLIGPLASQLSLDITVKICAKTDTWFQISELVMILIVDGLP